MPNTFIYLFVIGQEIVPTWNPQNLKFIWGKGSFHYVSHIGHVKFFQKMGIYHIPLFDFFNSSGLNRYGAPKSNQIILSNWLWFL